VADPRTTRPDDPLSAFGPNEWLVDELYEQYLQDKNSVDKAWWAFFADYSPDGTPGPNGGNGAAPTAEVKAAPAPAKAAPGGGCLSGAGCIPRCNRDISPKR